MTRKPEATRRSVGSRFRGGFLRDGAPERRRVCSYLEQNSPASILEIELIKEETGEKIEMSPVLQTVEIEKSLGN